MEKKRREQREQILVPVLQGKTSNENSSSPICKPCFWGIFYPCIKVGFRFNDKNNKQIQERGQLIPMKQHWQCLIKTYLGVIFFPNPYPLLHCYYVITSQYSVSYVFQSWKLSSILRRFSSSPVLTAIVCIKSWGGGEGRKKKVKNTPQILSTYRTYIGTDSLASNMATHQYLILCRWNYYKGRFWLQFSFCNHFKMLISISDTAFCSALLWISLVLSLLTPSLPLPTALSPENFRFKEEKGTNGKGRWENGWGENRKY